MKGGNEAVNRDANWVMWDALAGDVYVSMRQAADLSVRHAVWGAVNEGAGGAMGLAVGEAVARAVAEDAPHLAVQDFLGRSTRVEF